MTAQRIAEQLEQARDLRGQLRDLEAGDSQEMLFQEWSPGRTLVKLWSMENGEEIEIPRYMAAAALLKRMRGGKYRFTTRQEEAPRFREGNVRCFLAEDSEERVSGLLEEAGLDSIAPCPAEHLRTRLSKRTHAEHRHPQSWATLQEFIEDKEREEERADRKQQTAAIMQLAGQRALAETSGFSQVDVVSPNSVTTTASTGFACDECDAVLPTAKGLQGHKRFKHELVKAVPAGL